jgi:hypothetical protein
MSWSGRSRTSATRSACRCVRTWRCRSWTNSTSGWRHSVRKCCPRLQRSRAGRTTAAALAADSCRRRRGGRRRTLLKPATAVGALVEPCQHEQSQDRPPAAQG